jgi:predicted AlkP superfamily pyrophosphatase or phosphodiesterase
MKKFLSAAAALLLSVAAIAAPPIASKKPKLVLTIVVDQFRYDYLTRFRSEYKAGLAQLLDKGAVFTNAHYEHFPTVTAVGHSTILTGALPANSGIIENDWYDYTTKKAVTSVSDDGFDLLGGTAGKRASSPRRLLVSTVGDELKMSGKGKPKVIGISIKDRAAILPAGHMADAAYWFDDLSGNFVSSTYYFASQPAWAKDFNASRTVDQFVGKKWTPIGQPAAKPFKEMPAKADKAYFGLMERTPYGSEILEMFAERAITAEKLGQNNWTDLLSVSFSSNDYVGHDLGPDSPEVHDISLQTDRILGRLFAFVNSKVGADNVLVVFTADHGVAPIAEVNQERKMPGGRLDMADLDKAVQSALARVFGPGTWIAGKSNGMFFLNRDLIREKKLRAADVQEEAARAVRELPHIARVYTREQIMRGELKQDRIGIRVRNGFNEERSADVLVIPEPYWVFSKKGTTHGAPYSYDSHVPVIFMGAGIKAGRYHTAVAVNDIAPTLASMLDVETPSGSEGRVLEEMFLVK